MPRSSSPSSIASAHRGPALSSRVGPLYFSLLSSHRSVTPPPLPAPACPATPTMMPWPCLDACPRAGLELPGPSLWAAPCLPIMESRSQSGLIRLSLLPVKPQGCPGELLAPASPDPCTLQNGGQSLRAHLPAPRSGASNLPSTGQPRARQRGVWLHCEDPCPMGGGQGREHAQPQMALGGERERKRWRAEERPGGPCGCAVQEQWLKSPSSSQASAAAGSSR